MQDDSVPPKGDPPMATSEPATPTLGDRALLAGRRAAVSALALFVLHFAGRQVGTYWSVRISVILLCGVVLLNLVPKYQFPIAVITGLTIFSQWSTTRFVFYHLILVVGAFGLRRRTWALVLYLAVGALIIPKQAFRLFYHWEFLHNWINSYVLGHVMLVTALWWMENRRGTLPETRFWHWMTLFLFPTHPMNAMNYGPKHLWALRTADERSVLRALAVACGKAVALWALFRFLPGNRMIEQSAVALFDRSFLSLWGTVFHSYLVVALTLSGTADVVTVGARMLGWDLKHSFQFALLAWNPVELWRRWAIYNRRLLLILVYFPLGGSERHRMLNVMMTFWASGFLLHTGWFGSKYWGIGAGGYRDQMLYFTLQGVGVCACLWLWKLIGKDPRSDRELRLSPGRILCTIGTQAMSAWFHVLVMSQNISFGERWMLMARCLGFGYFFDFGPSS